MHNLDRITSLFVEDGIWESPAFGKATGHEEIRTLFESFRGMFSFSQHNVMNPRIEIQGEKATGVWYTWGRGTIKKTVLLYG